MAAVLASGDGAVVSHRSAAVLWGLLAKDSGIVNISLPGTGGKKRRQGIRIHRSRTLTAAHVTRRNSIPVTKPARTIADLRGSVPAWELRRAIRQATVLGLPLGPDVEPDRSRSDLELLFLDICHRHRLPEPEVNQRIGHIEVDFLWRERRLIVETDGYKYHSGKEAFLSDHDRDLRLRAFGYDVIRLSEEQVANEPTFVANVLRSELGPASGGAPS